MRDRIISTKDIPQTLSELPKKMRTEPLIHVNIMLRPSLAKKLHDKSLESGYPQQEIIDKALEAFLK